MSETIPTFDKLPQGTGYAAVPYPGTDADTDDRVSTTQHVPDSINDSMKLEVVSIETTSFDGPMNPAPYWNSGEKETLTILE